MSGGGGKGGSKTQETTIPAWIRDPAIRNLQRAEDVQRIEYMPYYGADVAAFTPTQNAAFDANIGAAEAFGLLAPNTLTATTGMPEPTDFNGFSAYSSQPLYESALAELKANQPDAVAQYDALFGANAMSQLNASRNRNRGGGGGVPTASRPSQNNFTPNYNSPHFQSDAHKEQIDPYSYVNQSDVAYTNVQPTMDYSSIKNQLAQEKAAGVGNYATKTPSYSSRLDSKGYTPMGK